MIDYWNTCPTCGATAYQPCRTRKTNRSTDTHTARIDGQFGPLRGDRAHLLDRLNGERTETRSLLQAAYDAGWLDGMDAGGWA